MTMLKKLCMLAIICGAAAAHVHGEDPSRVVIINLDYDDHVPSVVVYRATRQASRLFARIGTQVQFRSCFNRLSDNRSGLTFDLYIGMEAPLGTPFGALGLSHPYRQDGRIEVFYSRIQGYKPVECRDLVLTYILTHEITHVLEGMQHHSPTGVMKETWEREDFKQIQAAKLGFDPEDLDLIHRGTEKRMELSRVSR